MARLNRATCLSPPDSKKAPDSNHLDSSLLPNLPFLGPFRRDDGAHEERDIAAYYVDERVEKARIAWRVEPSLSSASGANEALLFPPRFIFDSMVASNVKIHFIVPLESTVQLVILFR